MPPSVKAMAIAKSIQYIGGHVRNAKLVFYTDFAEYLRDITNGQMDFTDFSFGANRKKLGNFLGELSKVENSRGRGMISACVVHKQDLLPHDNFFDYARELNYKFTDKVKFQKEMEQVVYKAWKSGGGK